jgi:two-component system, chemotaxis family, chemotaxis protein CheY
MAESEDKSAKEVSATAEAQAPVNPVPVPNPQTPTIKDCIVVAEDSKPNREIIVQVLRKLGFEVLVFENGKKAWDEVSKTEKPVVAIFSDIMMPEMDGMEFLKLVRSDEKLKAIPFVFVTAVMQRELIIEAKKLGTNGYLLKPITTSTLQVKLKELFPDKKLVLG